MEAWNKNKKMPHSKEWEEKRLLAIREAAKNRIYKRGYKRPSEHTKPMIYAFKKYKEENYDLFIKQCIKNLPKNNKKENNGNWRNGITKENYNWRLANYEEYKEWRNIILKKYNYECSLCGSNKNLEAHHIIPIKDDKDVAFELWNGTCLCRNCHTKTSSWGASKKENKTSFGYIRILTIPHKWQEYKTVGNWKFTKSGNLIILVSETGNEKYNMLIAIHELIESILCKQRNISEEDITKFDIAFDGDGEPGDDINSPYRKEHFFATSLEKLFAGELGVNWEEYDNELIKLF